MQLYRQRISKDSLRTECPAAHRTILVESCTQGADQHCDCFKGIEMDGAVAFVLCDYGLEDRQKSFIMPVGSGVTK